MRIHFQEAGADVQPASHMALEEYIDPGTVESTPLVPAEIRALGEAADAAMRSFATAEARGPEVTILSVLLCLENRLLPGGTAAGIPVDFSGLLAPVLDCVVPHVAIGHESHTVRQEDIARVANS
jgi:hypothetical protein